MLECHFKSQLGMECPGCGAQRSFFALLEGDLIGSLMFFPALTPLLFTILFLILHLIFKFKRGAKIITVSFAITAIIMLVNFIYKQILFFN